MCITATWDQQAGFAVIINVSEYRMHELTDHGSGGIKAHNISSFQDWAATVVKVARY